MNKKGFTLIELLAVITLISLILAISVPSFTNINKLIKNSMLKRKLDYINEKAILYGEDRIDLIKNSNKLYNNYQCLNIKVHDLLDDYIESDNNCEFDSYKCILDPSNDNKYLDNLDIIIYFKNDKIYSIINQDNNLSCS